MATDANNEGATGAGDATTKKTGMGSTASPSDKHLAENSKENLDEKLDNASEESFPGSDPVSVKITK